MIVVFAKAPRPGLVKTRMCPPLTPDQAAELYSHLLDDVLFATVEIGQSLALEPVLAVYPHDAQRELSGRAQGEYRVVPQRGRDLGERMTWAALEAAATGARRVLLRGSDSPVLGVETVASVLDALESTDVAISPDEGGGYALIGMRRPVSGLFAHAMSTRSVLDDTLRTAASLGMSTKVIGPSFDLNTAADLMRLSRARAEGAAILCPRLLAYLDENDLWPEGSAP